YSTTGFSPRGARCQTITLSPSFVSSATSWASGKPAIAGGVCSRSGKYISERCAAYTSATSPPNTAAATMSHSSRAMARLIAWRPGLPSRSGRRLTPMSSHGADETLRDITALDAGLSVDKAAVRDRRKLFVVVRVAADGAPVPAVVAGAVAAVAAADGAPVPA